MSLEFNKNDYFFRDSIFNLVELSLLAKIYAEYGVPRHANASVDKQLISQTLLKMKATEKSGLLKVAIYKTDPVGFLWVFEDRQMALCVVSEHQGKGLEQELRSSLS